MMNNEIISKLNLITLNRVPKGYIKNKSGIYPKDWKIESLGMLCNKITDGTHKTPSYKETGVKFISAKNIINNRIDWEDVKYISQEEHEELIKRCNPEDGDIVLSKSGTLGAPALIDKKFEFSLFESLALIKYDRKLVNGNYLFQYLLSPNIQRVYHLETKGLSVKHLHLEEIRKFKLLLPSLEEQERIANVLSHWDKAIELQEKFLQEKQKQKKGLIERLFSEKVRVKGYTGTWNKIKLSDILEVRNEKSQITDKLELFSLTIEDGVTPKTDRYNREFLVKEDNKKYKITKYNDIVYNPANLRFGAITLNKVDKDVLLSPIYETLYIKDYTKYDIDFIGAILTTDSQIKRFSTMAEGTLIERMAVKVKDFINFKIKVPNSIEEQKEIAKIINTSQREIDLIKEEIEHLKEQKKGLMQLLLTGIVRVKCD